VFEGIRHEFIHYQPALNRQVGGHHQGIKFDLHPHGSAQAAFRGDNVFRQRAGVLGKVDATHVFGIVEGLVHQGHRANTPLHIAKDVNRVRIPGVSRLQVEQAANYSEIVFYAVMHFSHQRLLASFAGALFYRHLLRKVRTYASW